MRRQSLTIGQVAAETGCNRETIRYYEKEKLLPAPERTAGGHRLYPEDLVKRLHFIRRLRELGFTMAEVRQFLTLVDRQQVSCEKVKKLNDIHLRDIRSKIADLRKIERTLRRLSDQCTGNDVPECPIIDVLYE